MWIFFIWSLRLSNIFLPSLSNMPSYFFESFILSTRTSKVSFMYLRKSSSFDISLIFLAFFLCSAITYTSSIVQDTGTEDNFVSGAYIMTKVLKYSISRYGYRWCWAESIICWRNHDWEIYFRCRKSLQRLQQSACCTRYHECTCWTPLSWPFRWWILSSLPMAMIYIKCTCYP